MVGAVEHEVQQVGGGKQGMLSIGTISSSSNLIPNAFSSGFAVDAPDVRFAIHEGNTFEVLDMLKAGVVDLGIVRTPFKMAGLAGKLSEPEPMVAVSWGDAGAQGAQGRGTDDIRIGELDDVPVVIYRRFERLIRKAFDDAGCRLTVGCTTDDARTALMWAHNGYGTALVPQRISAFFTQDSPRIRTLKCKDLVTRQALVWQEGRYLSPSASPGCFPASSCRLLGRNLSCVRSAPERKTIPGPDSALAYALAWAAAAFSAFSRAWSSARRFAARSTRLMERSSSASSASVPSMPSRSPFTLLPMAWPSLGRFFGPKMSSATTRMMISSGVPIPRICIGLLLTSFSVTGRHAAALACYVMLSRC